MPSKTKPTKEVVKKVEKKNPEVTQAQVDALWDIVEKVQKDLNYIGEKVERILNRLGLNI